MTKAIVTGCFDPITLGHVDIIKKAAKMFDIVYVVALNNNEKKPYFSLKDRKEMLNLVKNELEAEFITNIVVDSYDGLTVDYMHSKGIFNIVRGIRNDADATYEEMVKKAMEKYDSNFKTIILNSEDKYKNISSTLVRKMLDNKEDISMYVPKSVKLFLKNK